MPVTSSDEPRATVSWPNFFKNLKELDEWASKPRNQTKLDGLLSYTPRSKIEGSVHENRGKLLVCHDYKGGYTESPSSLAYSFNFWDKCDTFIYFSHQRVSIPPPGWVNAAHRQGVKVLGVLIFEHQESIEDTLCLLLGKLPRSHTGPPSTLTNGNLPISRHYARLLADLAYERGFDGYLLNFEFPFPGQSEQARAVEAWVSLLRMELKCKVGDYTETIWYDSVITTGQLRWQDRLNSRNLSFLLASDTFFINYTWPPSFPSFSAQYLLGLRQEIFQGNIKQLRDIYVGIDAWGRGCHGGGGLGAFRAAEHIDPAGLGLSVALFGPAWSWECDEGQEGRTWEIWWERERTLWVGPSIEGAHVEVPDPPLREGELPCPHGEFRPLSDFFESKAPPKPDLIPFCTTFCPGVGYGWFVEGRRLMYKETGWTDIDKQTTLGNLLWPRPKIIWEGTGLEEALPKGTTELVFDDAFTGGSCVRLTVGGEGSSADEPAFRCFWIPIQSIPSISGGLYEVELVYKASSSTSEFDVALSVKGDTEMEINPLSTGEFENGWSKLSITCKPSVASSSVSESDVLCDAGIILAVASENASVPYNISIHIGQLSVSPKSPLPNLAAYTLRLLWADCTHDCESDSPDTLVITWDACISYTSPATVGSGDVVPEVPRPPWMLDRSPNWFPRLMYANIYAEKRTSERQIDIRPSQSAMFLGTSGWGSGATTGGGPNCFLLDQKALPLEMKEGRVRVYVQGVTDRGAVLPWECCAFVDLDL